MASGLAVPPGDPDALQQQLDQLQLTAQTGVAGLSRSTLLFTSNTRDDAQWTGESSDQFAAYGTNLANGVSAAGSSLNDVVGAVQPVVPALRQAQSAVKTFNAISTAADNDSSGSLLSMAEQAGRNAMDAVSALNEAYSQATAQVTSALEGLDPQQLFGNGPVQGFINSQRGLGEDLPLGGWKPGEPIPPQIISDPGAPDLGLPQGDPVPEDPVLEILGNPGAPDLGLPVGDPVPEPLGPTILGNPGASDLGPVINFDTPGHPDDQGGGGQEPEDKPGYTPTPGTPAEDFDPEEIAWLAYQHSGGGDDPDRPTFFEVEQTLENGKATPIDGQNSVQVDYEVNGKDVRVIVNETMPTRSTTYYPGSLGPPDNE